MRAPLHLPCPSKNLQPRTDGTDKEQSCSSAVHPFARLRLGRTAPPAPPAPGVGDGANMAAGTPANDLDRHEGHGALRRQERHQGLGFHLEMLPAKGQPRPGLQMDEAKAASRVREGPACAPRSCRLIQEFACRRSQGMACGCACGCRQSATPRSVRRNPERPVLSSGACWPSPSRVKAHAKPCFFANDNPVLSAAPLPKFLAWLTTVAPASRAASAVASVEPSSTTITEGRRRRTALTSAGRSPPR